MIDINEIRIGNIFYFSGVGIDIETGSISAGVSSSKHKIDPLTFILLIKFPCFRREFNPIPLTPEILEKCGALFKYNWLLDPIELSNTTTEDFLEFEYQTPYLDWRIISVKYVHQLQNLYFALTGEELEINL